MDIRPKKLLHFMADTGLIDTKRIITNNENAQEADYEFGADIWTANAECHDIGKVFLLFRGRNKVWDGTSQWRNK